MAKKIIGLSLDFIIHPGETIKEFLEARNMTQEELAIRTGFSAKHISEVVNGKKDISPAFAKSLEYVFGTPMSFWVNLQGIYDREMLEYNEQQEIDDVEIGIAKKLKDVIKYAEEINILPKIKNDITSQIIELRNMCNITKLNYIHSLYANKVAFRKSQTIDTDIDILYAWLRICELYSKTQNVKCDYDEQVLKNNIENIKKCMLLPKDKAVERLKDIFSKCGIIFQVVKSIKGAPVQGFIKKYDEKIILTMTTRRKFADEFWFTLFHEIGHLLNGDVNDTQFIDYQETKSQKEILADNYASNVLINEEEYIKFISENIDETKIKRFAKSQNVAPFIVVGRLQKDNNDYRMFYNLKEKYDW